jgi:hypothetical protein
MIQLTPTSLRLSPLSSPSAEREGEKFFQLAVIKEECKLNSPFRGLGGQYRFNLT